MAEQASGLHHLAERSGTAGRIAGATGPAMLRRDGGAVAWRTEHAVVAYADAIAFMEARVDAIRRGHAGELVWLVEHPPLFTAGTSAPAAATLPGPALRFPLHQTGRGGQVTYHGPGQRVVYLMLDLQSRTADVRAFVAALERWIIAALAAFGIRGLRRDDRVGVWVERPDKRPALDGTAAEDKIAAIGIRVRRWVTFHGVSLNVDPDLSHYADIIPCGIAASQYGVTSLADLGRATALPAVDAVLAEAFVREFGPLRLEES